MRPRSLAVFCVAGALAIFGPVSPPSPNTAMKHLQIMRSPAAEAAAPSITSSPVSPPPSVAGTCTLPTINVVLPSRVVYSESMPAGVVRTVKTVRTAQQAGRLIQTVQIVRYERPRTPLPLCYLEIPAIKLRARVVEGVSQKAMARGPGHMPGMALPGEVGNCAIAGHSNVPGCDYFRRLNRLRPGDRIYIDTTVSMSKYVVIARHVVSPRNVSDLRPVNYRRLTLITCWLPDTSRRLVVVAVAPEDVDKIRVITTPSPKRTLPEAGRR